MSKKILKRSLALGALMAFVITGSAMAESIQPGHVYNNMGQHKCDCESIESHSINAVSLTIDTSLSDGIKWNGHNSGDNLNPNYSITYLNGNKLTVNGTVACGSHIDYNDEICNDIGYKFISGEGRDLGSLEIKSNEVGIKGFGKIEVDSLRIESADKNAVYSGGADKNASWMPHTTTEIYANKIEIISNGDNAFMVHNNMEIGKENDQIDTFSISGDYARAFRINGKADVWSNVTPEGEYLNASVTVNVYADTLNISGAKEAIKVDDKGILNLNANKGIITNEFYAAKEGTVNATLGAGVEWIGKFVTDDVATNSILDLSGNWTLKDVASDTTGKVNSLTNATFRTGSTFVIDGATYEASKGVYALNGVGENATLTVENGAKLKINGITETTYNIAKDFTNLENAVNKWEVSDINALMQGVAWTSEEGLQVTVSAKEVDKMASETGMSTSTAGLVQGIIENKNNASTPAQEAAVEFIQNVVDAYGNDNAAVGNAINSATKMAEAGGNSATAANIVKNVTGVTNDRLSFNCGHSAPHKGGHGVGLFEEGSGADIWVEYVHGKDKVEDMPSTAGASSYEGQYNGIVMGVDFKKVGKFQSGIAFNYGEGDTNSVGNAVRTHSDYDFWGVGYYGNIHNDDSNVIFDVNFAKTDSDVTQNNSGTAFEASPETATWSAGVKLEKLYQNENVQIVPYTGLRYMSIDSDDYATKNGAFMYSMDRQDIWLLPLGVSIRQEIANDNGWTVSPRVDLSYIWAFGDTNSNMEVKSPFAGVSQLGYDVMDDGSFLGLVGIEAHKGQWGYGVAYSYQKGDHSESKKWYVDVNYSF